METKLFNRWGEEHKGGFHAFDATKGTALYTYQDKCSRCGGAGRSDKWMFTGYTCFDCSGSGKGLIRDEKLYTAEKLAKLNATQAKREAKRTAKAAAEQAAFDAAADAKRGAFEAEHAELLAGMREFPNDSFLSDLLAKGQKWGTLTPGQIAAAAKSVARLRERARVAAGSQHVGVAGERMEFTLTIEKVIDLGYDADGNRTFGKYDFRPPIIHLMRDAQGNRIVYKGSNTLGAKDEVVSLKATIKEHGERNGEKQTIIARPKVAAPPAEEAPQAIEEPAAQ